MTCEQCGGMNMLYIVDNTYKCRECGYLFEED